MEPSVLSVERREQAKLDASRDSYEREQKEKERDCARELALRV